MTSDRHDDKVPNVVPPRRAGGAKTPAPAIERHIYGPRALGAVLPSVIRPAYRRRSPASAQILLDWEVIVGPAIAAVTTPRKLFSGTLSIVCPGPVAMELQHLSDAVIGRINSHFGRTIVTRLRFIQDITAQPPPPPPPRPQARQAARRAVESLPAGELREALERLGRLVLTERGR